FGVQGFLVKTAMGLSSFGTTWLLETFGYTGERALGLVFLGPLAALFVLAGIAALSGYRADVVRGETGVPYQTIPPASSRIWTAWLTWSSVVTTVTIQLGFCVRVGSSASWAMPDASGEAVRWGRPS